MKAFLICCLASMFIAGQSVAQEVKITANISMDTVLLGSYVEVEYTIDNANGRFVAPPLDSFYVVSGPNQSSSYSMINGEVTQRASYAYYLMPTKPGHYVIESGQFRVGESTYQTPSLNLYVMENPDFDPMSIPQQNRPLKPAPKTEQKKKRKVIRI